MEIRYKSGTRLKAKPEDAYRVLEEIRADNGGDIPLEEIVARSKPKDAPLHNDFEWNNARAGDAYRRIQAGYIVRRIEVIRDEAPHIQARAYESVEVVYEGSPRKDNSKTIAVYRSTEDILKDPTTRDTLLSQAVRDALAFRRRYHALSELSQVFTAIEEFEKKLVG